MMNQPNNAANSTLLRVACALVRARCDLAVRSNGFDRATIITEAFALVLIWVLGFIAWTGLFSLMLGEAAALFLGLLVSTLIALIDQSLGAADWELKGVLRTQAGGAAFWGRVAMRMVIGIGFASATAFGVQMVIFRHSIEQNLQATRQQANAPVLAEYNQKKLDLKAERLTPLQVQMDALQRERESLMRELSDAARLRNSAIQAETAAEIERSRELHGDMAGYQAGEGPRYREAERQAEAAAVRLEHANIERERAALRVAEIDAGLATKQRELDAAGPRLQRDQAEVHAAMLTDQRWIAPKTDILLATQALIRMGDDPETGAAVRKVQLMAHVVVLCLEFAFLMLKLVFAPTSVYTVRLVAEAKLEAQEINADYERRSLAIQESRPKAKVHVLRPAPERAADARD